jgi:hypothetical protein
MVEIEKEYVFAGPDGKASLLHLVRDAASSSSITSCSRPAWTAGPFPMGRDRCGRASVRSQARAVGEVQVHSLTARVTPQHNGRFKSVVISCAGSSDWPTMQAAGLRQRPDPYRPSAGQARAGPGVVRTILTHVDRALSTEASTPAPPAPAAIG